MLAVSELLKLRYKVINLYPNCPYSLGEIIIVEDPSVNIFRKYPLLFRKLKWWEGRCESEMPNYIMQTIYNENDFPRKKYIEIAEWNMERHIATTVSGLKINLNVNNDKFEYLPAPII